MRKSTLLWLLLATLCGIGLFHTSQKLHDDRVKIILLDRNIAQEEESLRVLHAEWSHLNAPARLEKLAEEHLGLSPLKGSQFTTVEALPLRGALPAVARIKHSTPPRIAAVKKPAPQKPPTKTAARSLGDVFKSLGVE